MIEGAAGSLLPRCASPRRPAAFASRRKSDTSPSTRVMQGADNELRTEIQRLRHQRMTRLVTRSSVESRRSQSIKASRFPASFSNAADTVAASVGRNAARAKVYLAEAFAGWNRVPIVVPSTGAWLQRTPYDGPAGTMTAMIVDAHLLKGVLRTDISHWGRRSYPGATARWYGPSGRSVQRPRPVLTADGTMRVQEQETGRAFHTTMGVPSRRTRYRPGSPGRAQRGGNRGAVSRRAWA